jgi:hypothetical protein
MLDRRLRAFEARVQQEVAIQDDEIARHRDYLTFVKAQILEARDALQRFTAQMEDARRTSDGTKRRTKARHQGKAGKIAADHDLLIQELEAAHSALLGQLTAEFTTALDEITGWAESRAKARVARINGEIERARKARAAAKAAPPADAPPFQAEDRDEAGDAHVAALEVALREKNADRLAGLQRMKPPLAQCLATLEALEQAHSARAAKVKAQLAAVEKSYGKKAAAASAAHARAASALRRDLADLAAQADAAEREVARVQEQHLRAMLDAGQVSDRCRTQLRGAAAPPARPREPITAALQWDAKLAELRGALAAREALLAEGRRQSEALRREVSRVRAERRAAGRRAALGG